MSASAEYNFLISARACCGFDIFFFMMLHMAVSALYAIILMVSRKNFLSFTEVSNSDFQTSVIYFVVLQENITFASEIRMSHFSLKNTHYASSHPTTFHVRHDHHQPSYRCTKAGWESILFQRLFTVLPSSRRRPRKF
jgi:hypothetical protein